MSDLFTANVLGVHYINDKLDSDCKDQTQLTVQTAISDPGSYGRSSRGWYVKGGIENSLLQAYADSGILPGNRSLLAKLKFMSTQTGINGEHGTYQIILVQSDWMGKHFHPLRVCADHGKFYMTGLQTELLAGDKQKKVYEQCANIEYTLSVVLFQKGIYARLSGSNIHGGYIDISVTDCKRFIPGYPGFALEANSTARSGEIYVSDWLVTPIGPYMPVLGAIGDSITAGLDNDPERNSYVHMVSRYFEQQWTLNTGSGGSRTSIDLKRFPIEIAPFKPKIVWIESGTNDITANIPAENIYRNMLEQIKLVDWGGIPLLSTVPPRNTDNKEHNLHRNLLNEMIRNSGYPVVDRNALLAASDDALMLNPMFDSGDGVHINIEGSRLIAARAIEMMRTLLPEEASRIYRIPENEPFVSIII